MRERYNFFLKNGVPKWRGTGYYYKRYRPGLGTVLIGLLALGSFLHYIIMWVNYFQERKRIRYYKQESREIAWGKRMKKQQTRKRVYVNDLAFIVEGDYVALLADNGEEYLLDEEIIAQPKVTDIMIFMLPGWIYKNIKEPFSKKKSSKSSDSLVIPEKESFSSDDEQSEVGENIRSKAKKRRGGYKRQNKS